MRITGLEKTIADLTAVKQSLEEFVSTYDTQIAELEMKKQEIEEQINSLKNSISDKKATIKELNNTLNGLNTLNRGVITTTTNEVLEEKTPTETEVPVTKIEEE